MIVVITQIRIPFFGFLSSSLFDHPFRCRASLIVDLGMDTSNSSRKNSSISERYESGFSSRWSHKASNMTGGDASRPSGFDGRSFDGTEKPQIRPDPEDCAFAAASSLSHLGCG
jgi:hypothetical protein